MFDAIGYYGQGGHQSAYWQNLYNQRAEWGPTYFDAKFDFVPSLVYELPFGLGRGRKMGKQLEPGVDSDIGGWQVGMICAYQHRLPAHY